MALQAFQGGLWIPSWKSTGSVAIDTTTFLMDAAGEYTALIGRVPKAGTLTRFEAFIAAVGNAPDNGLRFSFQGVSLTTGLPDAVITQSITTAVNTPAAAGWLNPGDFGASRTVARGDLLALVVDIPTFVAGDSVTVGGTTYLASAVNFPYSARITGTKSGTTLPLVGLRYSDGTFAYLGPDIWAMQSIGASNIGTTSTPDEAGLAFTVPVPCRLAGVQLAVATGAAGRDYEIVIYDAANTVLLTQACDADVVAVTTTALHTHLLTSPITLTPNVVYRVIMKPTTTGLVGLNYAAFNALALMDSAEGGRDWYLTTRTDAGAWTDFNSGTFRKPRISLLFDAFDDAVSLGGASAAVSFG
jgi:hypothetical protein